MKKGTKVGGFKNSLVIIDPSLRFLLIKNYTVEVIGNDSYHPGIIRSAASCGPTDFCLSLGFFHEVKPKTKIKLVMESENKGSISILVEFDGKKWQLVEGEE